MNKHVTVNSHLENPELSHKSHVDDHLFSMSQLCGGLGGKKDLPLATPKDEQVRKIVVLGYFVSWHQSFLREKCAITWLYSFFLPVVAVADTEHLLCTIEILIHSGRPDKKPAEGSSHPEVSGGTIWGIIQTSNGYPIPGHALKERRKGRRKFFSSLMLCGKLYLISL